MSYPGRQHPLAVEFGKHAEPAPLNVSHLIGGRIILTGGRGLSGRNEPLREIPFVDEGKLWENEDLFFKLTEVNSTGVPFQYQPKEVVSPAALMAWWQETGKLKDSFKEISWSGPDSWYVTTIEPPLIGILGWSGPKPFGC